MMMLHMLPIKPPTSTATSLSQPTTTALPHCLTHCRGRSTLTVMTMTPSQSVPFDLDETTAAPETAQDRHWQHHHHHNNAQETITMPNTTKPSITCIMEEAADYGISVERNENGYIQFFVEWNEAASWMVHHGDKQWHAYSAGGDSYVGGKRSAASWCLDIAVNGEK
jgi:hypothetical protein